MRSITDRIVVLARCLGAALWLTALTGCAETSSLGPGYVADASRDEFRIYRLRHAAIVDRQTTLAELQSILGPPDQTSDDGRTVGYLWDVERWDHGAVKVKSKRSKHDEHDANGNYTPGAAQAWYKRDVSVSYVNRFAARRHFLLLGVDEAGVVQWSSRSHCNAAGGLLPTLSEVMKASRDQSGGVDRVLGTNRERG